MDNRPERREEPKQGTFLNQRHIPERRSILRDPKKPIIQKPSAKPQLIKITNLQNCLSNIF